MAKTEVKSAPEPNIIFTRRIPTKVTVKEEQVVDGKKTKVDVVKTKKVLAEAPKRFLDSDGTSIPLPPSEEQHRGFYHPKATRIIRAFPDVYKRPSEKDLKAFKKDVKPAAGSGQKTVNDLAEANQAQGQMKELEEGVKNDG